MAATDAPQYPGVNEPAILVNKKHGVGRIGEATTISIVDQRTKKLVKITAQPGQSLLKNAGQRLPLRNSDVSKSQNLKRDEQFSMVPMASGAGALNHPSVLQLHEAEGDKFFSHNSATNLNLSNSVSKRYLT